MKKSKDHKYLDEGMLRSSEFYNFKQDKSSEYFTEKGWNEDRSYLGSFMKVIG